MLKSILPPWIEEVTNAEIAKRPTWLFDFRQKQKEAFVSRGFPNRKNEQWKYTDLEVIKNYQIVDVSPSFDSAQLNDVVKRKKLPHAHLIVFVDGKYSAQLSELPSSPQFIIKEIIQAAVEDEALIKQHIGESVNPSISPFVAFNGAYFKSGIFVYLPKTVQIPCLHILNVVTSASLNQIRNIFILDEKSEITVVEEFFSLSNTPYLNNVVNNCYLKSNAKYTLCKIQEESINGIHLAYQEIRQAENAESDLIQFSKGGKFSRDDVNIKLQGRGASAKTSGFYQTNHDGQYVDYHIDILHESPQTQSEMLYKGIIDGQSRAVFNGKLKVEPNAQKIVAYQENHNLLLSNSAEVYSKPELEIYADDVKCKHGATTGQLDANALFYLQSRGIELSVAKQMLLKGFAQAIIDRVKSGNIRLTLEEKFADENATI